MMSASSVFAGFEQDAGFGEAIDLVGHHGRLARLDAVKQIANAMRCRQGR
jgi:hypothetical protein